MTNKSIIKFSLMSFALIIICNVAAFAQKTDCANTPDNDIVIAVYNKIKVKYADQVKHINVRIKDGVLTLEGWGTTKKVVKEIEKFARKTDCVKQVVNTLTIGKGGGCAPGMKECGGICIPEKEACNICLAGGCK